MKAQSVAEVSTVYVGSYNGTLYAVDAGTGSEEWAFKDDDMKASMGCDGSETHGFTVHEQDPAFPEDA